MRYSPVAFSCTVMSVCHEIPAGDRAGHHASLCGLHGLRPAERLHVLRDHLIDRRHSVAVRRASRRRPARRRVRHHPGAAARRPPPARPGTAGRAGPPGPPRPPRPRAAAAACSGVISIASGEDFVGL